MPIQTRSLATAQGPDSDHATQAHLQARGLTSREIGLRFDSVNEDERSVEAVMSTERVVQVFDWREWRIIDEVLQSDGAEFGRQVVLLESHARWSTDTVIGSVRGMRAEGENTVGRLFFAKDDERADRIWNKVRQGHLDSVSVGYRIDEATEIKPNSRKIVGGREYRAGDRPLRVATKWRLLELSVVPIGADPGAKLREEVEMPPKLRTYLEEIGLGRDADDDEAERFFDALTGDQRIRAKGIRNGTIVPADKGEEGKSGQRKDGGQTKTTITTEEPIGGDGQRQSSPPPISAEAVQAAVRDAVEAERAAERERVAAIREICGDDIDVELRERAIAEGWTADRTREAALTWMRTHRSDPVPSDPNDNGGGRVGIHSRSRERDVNVRSLAAALCIGQGLDPLKCQMHNGDRPIRGATLTEQDADLGDRFASLPSLDIMRECARIDTGRWHLDPREAFRAAVSGGTLSYVFTTNVHARLLAGWDTIGDTTAGWCDEEDVANFMTQEDISIAAQARLERLPRGDTAKHATISDAHETYSIARYAKQFAIDEQDIIDDRLGALMRMPEEMGAAARSLRPDMVYSIMLENPTMTDTGEVFNATAVTTAGGHANLGTAVLGNDALKAAITAMVSQRINRTATDPGQQLNVRPRFLIVPAAREWDARTLTSAAALAKLFADSSDPWYPILNLIAQEGLRTVIDDRIGAIGVFDPRSKVVRTGLDTNWFLAMGGNRGLRVAYRRGTGRRPLLRRFTLDRGQWGLGWDVNMDIGVAFTEWRTWYKSTGAA